MAKAKSKKRRSAKKRYRTAGKTRRRVFRKHLSRVAARRGRLPKRGRYKYRGKRPSYTTKARNRRKYKMKFRGRKFFHNPRRGRKNGLDVVWTTIKAAAPIAGAFVAGRFVTGIIASKLGGAAPAGSPQVAPSGLSGMVPGFIAPHLGPLVSLGLIAVAGVLGSRVAVVQKYQVPIYIGLGLNAISVFFAQYAPASVKGMIGMGSDGLYDEALAAYETDATGDLGDYLDTGAVEELADYNEDLAEYSEGFSGAAGLGASPSRMLAPVRSARMTQQVPAHAMTREVPAFGRQKSSSMFAGIFKSCYPYAE